MLFISMYIYILQAESMQEHKFRERERVLIDNTIRSGYEAPGPKQAEWVLIIVDACIHGVLVFMGC